MMMLVFLVVPTFAPTVPRGEANVGTGTLALPAIGASTVLAWLRGK